MVPPFDVDTTAAWMNCNRTTVQRHAKKLIAARILGDRTVYPSEKGGRPRTVYDVLGGVD